MLQRITNNWRLKLTSFLLAVGLWSHVRGEVNPWEKKTFNVRLAHDPPTHLILVNEAKLPAAVTVTLRGPRHSLSEIRGGNLTDTLSPLSPEEAPYVTGGEITAQLDYLQAHRGQQTVPITIKLAPTIQDMADIVDWKPRDINVTLDQATSARFRVQPQFALPDAVSYRVAQVSANPDAVELSGPSKNLGQVAKVRAKVTSQDLALNAPRHLRVPVVALDDNGDVVKGITVEPATTQVTGTLLENQLTRRLKVSLAWRGSLAPDYRVTQSEIVPSRLVVRGPQRLLTKLTTLSVPLDLNGATSTFSRRVSVSLPPGITAGATRQVTIRVHIARAGTGEPTARGEMQDNTFSATPLPPVNDLASRAHPPSAQGHSPALPAAPADSGAALSSEKSLPPPAARNQHD